MKHNIKMFLSPHLKLIHRCLRNNLIDILHGSDNCSPLLERNNWSFMFIGLYHFICADPDYQIITLSLCSLQDIQMSDMKHIKDS